MENKNWFKDVEKEKLVEKKRLTVDIDKELFTVFKAHCVSSGQSMGSVVSELLENHLKVNDLNLK